MINKIEERRERILTFIEKYTAEHRCPPTVREILKISGAKSTSTIFGDLQELERRELIEKIGGSDNGGAKYAPRYTESFKEELRKYL